MLDWQGVCNLRSAFMRRRLTLGLAVVALLLSTSSARAGVLDASWTLPTTNSDGTPLTDLALFRIYYASGSTPCPGPFVLQMSSPTSTPQANQSATFRLTGLQGGTTYFVAVTAVDFSGSESACSTEASAAARSSVSVSPAGPMNFGGVALGAFADQTFTVQNTVGGTVSGAVSVPAPFSVVSGSPFTLAGLNAAQTVTVRFKPTTVATANANVAVTADGDTIGRSVSGTGTGAATLTSLTANLTAPQSPGSTITFTATATGGAAPYQFKWWLFNGTTWAMAKDWSTSNTFAWTPSTPNPNSAVGVWVRSAGETADQRSDSLSIPFPIQASFASLTGLTANLTAPQSPGSTITFTATATGGTAPHQFKWWLFNGTTWAILKDWSTSNTFAWTPNTPNPNSAVGVWVRSAGETADQRSDSLSIPFPIQASFASLTGLTANLTAPQSPGSTITFTATATGGTAPHQFKWWLFNGTTWAMTKDWSTSNTFAWTPNTPNPNSAVGVWVRSAGETADQRSDSLSIPFPIQASFANLTGLTANLTAPQSPGSTITFTATATAGAAPYQFKWWLFNGTTWAILKDWSTSNTFAWTPSTPNPNSAVGVWVRSAGETADQRSDSLSIPFPIQASFASLTGLTANLTAPQSPGSTITFTATATGGTAPHQFKWWLFDGTTWAILKDWSTSNTFAWTPSTPNPNSAVGVWVRSAGETADQRSDSLSIPFPID